MSAKLFPSFDRAALAALQSRDVPRARVADYFNTRPAAEVDQELARLEAYLTQFAKLTDAKCLCCGTSLLCPFGMGVFGGFEWGLVHGEGRCSTCGYPMRGHHRVEGFGVIRNLFLPYHPSTIVLPPEDEPCAVRSRSMDCDELDEQARR